MALYHFRAVSQDGEVQQGELEAGDERAALEQLHGRGLIVLDISTRRGWTELLQADVGDWWQRGREQRLVLPFTQQLAALLRAGVPLDRALEIMRRVGGAARLQRLVGPVQEGVRRGASLSRVLASRPELFSSFYISLVQAAEASGDLAEGLERLAYYLERSKGLRERLVSALIYPAVLLAVSVASLLIILAYVIPQFRQLFDDMGASLPLATQIVIAIAETLREQGLWLLLGLLGGVWLLRRLLREEAYRRRWDARVLRLPLLGTLRQRIETARFTRSLGTLLKGGVPLLQALGIARQTLGSLPLVAQLDLAADGLRQGRTLAAPLLAGGLFPPLALQMIQVGEETGRLDDMLLKVADTYDREVEVAMQRLVAILEPLLIVGLGLMIAGIILSVLVAIMSITEIPI